jgi:putative ABC transport system permease protein
MRRKKPMRALDTLSFARHAASGTPLRTGLLVLAMSIGVAAVIMLTALGDGARRYVVEEFSAIGSNLLIVLPGRSETGGLNPANLVTSTPRDLTTEDAASLIQVAGVRKVAPIVVGSSEISVGGKLREVMLVGTSSDFLEVRHLKLAQGRFLPPEDVGLGSNVAVIGAVIRDELFGHESPLGKPIRVGDRRFRVIGVLGEGGRGMGMTTNELIIVPTATALAMFDTNTLFRILIEGRSREELDSLKSRVEKTLSERHDGEKDFTLITQDAVLQTFDKILRVLTLGVAGIAAISLAVAGILVMNVMLVSVTQRTSEIGLLKALGATAPTIRNAFLAEAAMLSMLGALIGVALGEAGAAALRQLYPVFPAYPPVWALLAGVSTALVTGILFGVMPARKAAQLDPVQALSKR